MFALLRDLDALDGNQHVHESYDFGRTLRGNDESRDVWGILVQDVTLFHLAPGLFLVRASDPRGRGSSPYVCSINPLCFDPCNRVFKHALLRFDLGGWRSGSVLSAGVCRCLLCVVEMAVS